MPPTAWMPKTSRLSSYLSMGLSVTTAHRQTRPATAPRTMAPTVPAMPAAGVVATRPATAPEAKPKRLAGPRVDFSARPQASAAAAGAVMVLRKACAVSPFDSRLEPALNPNQPTQSRQAPMNTKVRLCGGIGSFMKPMRGPRTSAATSAAIPELRSEEHTSELQSRENLVCRLLVEKK